MRVVGDSHAPPRRIGAFIESHLADKVVSKSNLVAGYKAMAADEEREKKAREWTKISGETIDDSPSF